MKIKYILIQICFILTLLDQNLFAHETALHSSTTNDGNMTKNAIEICNSAWDYGWLSSIYQSEIYDGSRDEDSSASRNCNHGYNPITGSTGGIFKTLYAGKPTKEYAIGMWENMEYAFGSGNLTGGDNIGAYHYLGRCCHLLQDMTTYPHIHPQDISGVPPEHQNFESSEYSQFVNFDFPNTDTPLLPTDSLTGVSKSTEKLDSWSSTRLCSKTFTSNDIASFIEQVARITYFRSTFWGEVEFVTDTWGSHSGEASPELTTTTVFSDGIVTEKPNTLSTLFGSENVRYRNTWEDDYFEITDAHGQSFTWKNTFDDEWFPCSGRTQDGHVSSGGDVTDEGVRTTGRFHFTTAYEVNPINYPNGTSFSQSSLGNYMSLYSMQVGLRYNAALMAVGSGLTYTLNIQSQNPSSGILTQLSSADGNNIVLGYTPFSSTYVYGERVTLTAPTAISGNRFSKWQKNGIDFSTQRQITITIKESDTYTVVSIPDINSDDTVNIKDFAILAEHWQDICSHPSWCEGSDLDLSSVVDLSDLLIICNSWLEIK